MHHRLLLVPFLLGLGLFSVHAQADLLDLETSPKDTDIQPTDVIHWDAVGAEVNTQGKVEALFRLRTENGFTIYTDKLTIEPPAGYRVENITYPPTRKIQDPISGKEVDVYYGGDFLLTMSGPAFTVGEQFTIGAKYIGCTSVICLFPYTETIDFEVLSVAPLTEAAAPTHDDEESFEESWAKKIKAGGLSFSLLVFALFVGGILSNLTPCVYPMIPITLRVLASQGKSPYASASMYALGIIVTYTTLGVVAAASGEMFGALMASKEFNAIFAVIMIAFGCSMLGFGNFSKLQMLGSRMGAGKPSLRNTFLMGAGAGLVASPCTGPLLATLLAYTAKNHTVAESSALLFVYSAGFALPYVLLGGAAAKVSQTKVSPSVQIGVKLFFAAVMFGLGFYYLRIPFYGVLAGMKELWLPIMVAALSIGGLGAIIWTLVPRLQNNKSSMLIPTVILGIGIFSASQWMASSTSSLSWYHDEARAYEVAAESGKPLLIDMWAEWCEACKKMDATTFKDPRVIDRLASDWVLLKLDLTESNDANDLIQEKYELQSLPTLVLVPADGNVGNKTNIMGYVTPKTLLENTDKFKSQMTGH